MGMPARSMTHSVQSRILPATLGIIYNVLGSQALAHCYQALLATAAVTIPCQTDHAMPGWLQDSISIT